MSRHPSPSNSLHFLLYKYPRSHTTKTICLFHSSNIIRYNIYLHSFHSYLFSEKQLINKYTRRKEEFDIVSFSLVSQTPGQNQTEIISLRQLEGTYLLRISMNYHSAYIFLDTSVCNQFIWSTYINLDIFCGFLIVDSVLNLFAVEEFSRRLFGTTYQQKCWPI